MQYALLDVLACPVDGSSPLRLDVELGEDGEVETGHLHCGHCGATFDVIDGIPSLVVPAAENYSDGSEDDAQRKREGQAFRDATAEIYDARRALRGAELHVRSLLDRCHVGSGDRILDAGSGTGQVSLRLAEAPCQIVAVDLSRASLRIQQQKLRAGSFKGVVHLVHADLNRLPIREKSFRLAVASCVLQDLPDIGMRQQPVKEIARVLADEAAFVFSVANHSGFLAAVLKRFPWLNSGEPYQREGFVWGKSYYRRWTAVDVKRVLGVFFEIRQIAGAHNFPIALLRRLGALGIAIDRYWQRLPFSQQSGCLLVVTCRKAVQVGGRSADMIAAPDSAAICLSPG